MGWLSTNQPTTLPTTSYYTVGELVDREGDTTVYRYWVQRLGTETGYRDWVQRLGTETG